MQVYNMHEGKKEEEEDPNYNAFAPKWPFQALVIGSQGSGKTNMLWSTIKHYLKFDKLFVYAKHADDPTDIYVDMKEWTDKIEEKVTNKMRKKLKDPKYEYHMATYSNTLDDLPNVEDFDHSFKSLIIVDDFIDEMTRENTDKLSKYYTGGRHKNVSIIFLSQDYIGVPKRIRGNANYIYIFNVPTESEIRTLASEYAREIPYQTFKKIIRDVITSQPYSFFTIDMKTKKKCLKFRQMFDQLIIYKPENN